MRSTKRTLFSREGLAWVRLGPRSRAAREFSAGKRCALFASEFATSLGTLGLLGLLPGGACAVPDRGDPPAPDIAMTTADTAGEISGDSESEVEGPNVSYAESIHSIQVAMCAPACHATGAGSYTISGDVDADYEATLLRVVVGKPDDSKLLKKVSGDASHQGGPLLPAGSEGYDLIAKWISDGALP